MKSEVTRDWDFVDNTREYISKLKPDVHRTGNSGTGAPEENIVSKLKKFGVFKVAWALFLWLPMELFPLMVSPFFYIWSLILRRKVPNEKVEYLEKVFEQAIDHYEITALNSPLDALMFHELSGQVINRPSVMVGAAPSPRMKFRGPAYFSTPLIYDDPIDIGSDILLSEMIPLKGDPAFHHLLVHSFQEMPFSDGSIGCVVAPHIIDHVPSRLDTIRETARVLRPGGVFLFTDVSEYFFAWQPIIWLTRKLRLERIFSRVLSRITTIYLGEAESLDWYRKVLDEEGFDVEVAKYWLSRRAHFYTQIAATFYRINKGVLVWHSMTMMMPVIGKIVRWSWMNVQRALMLYEVVNPPVHSGIEIALLARKRGNSENSKPGEENILDSLVCPRTHEPLVFDESKNEFRSSSGIRYPVIEGIPILVPEIAKMYYDTYD